MVRVSFCTTITKHPQSIQRDIETFQLKRIGLFGLLQKTIKIFIFLLIKYTYYLMYLSTYNLKAWQLVLHAFKLFIINIVIKYKKR